MTDPLSLTLAALTLASALKDMVELAQAIEESFEKVSRNRRELRSLVSEIKTTVFQLKKFSDDHYDILCDAVDTKLAILGLITDMRTVYDKCREMIPPVPPNRMGRLKLDVMAWLKNNKIDEDIKNLRNRVNKCHSEFMMFSVMRIESRLIVMTRQTDEHPKRIQEEITTLRPSNDSLIAFVGSNARTLSKLPPEITADFISNTYLSLQINTIDDMLNQLPSTSYPVGDPRLSFRPVVSQNYAQDKNVIRQKLIFHSLEIQSYLRRDSQNMSIQGCALSMTSLCLGLFTLKLYQEARTTCKWIINLFKALAQMNPQRYLHYLVRSHCIRSLFCLRGGDFDGSVSALEEAMEISNNLQSSAINIEIGFQLASSLTTLAYTWGQNNRKEESLKAALDGIVVYKNAINRSHERATHGLAVILVNSPMASLLENIPLQAVRGYGRALKQLSFSFQASGRQHDAYSTAREALDVMMFSSNTLNDSDKILEVDIALMLFRISHQYFHNFLSLEEALSLSERAVTMLRYLYHDDSEQHGISLCNALWQQANILGKLERWDEATVCWRETAELGNEIVADQLFRAEALSHLSWSLRKMKRHDEAASIRTESVMVYSRNEVMTDKVAHGYFNLGVELRLADRRPEAIKALQVALTQYRALAFKNPEYTKSIGITLNQLAMIFIHSKEFYQAFNESHESLQLHESLIKNDSSVLTDYIFAIRLNSLAAEVADNEEKCVERARYNVSCARTLATLHPTEANLLFCQMLHSLALVLFRFGWLSEAGLVLQEALEWHEKHPSQEEKHVEQYMICLITMTAIVYNQGHALKAAEYLQTSIDIGRPRSSHKPVSSALAGSMHRQAQIFYITGLYAEFVEASQECVDFGRQTKMENMADFIGCLHVAAIAFKYHGNFQQAIHYIQEALQLSRSSEILETSKSRPTFLVLEPESLTCFCEILADAGEEAEALVKGKAAVDSALGLKSKHALLPWSSVEPTYFRALETYSIRLAANGDLSDSLDRLVQVRSYYENKSKSQLADALNLACVLEAEGMICCAAGRPDDAAAAVAKLRDLQNRLRFLHPELAKNVKVALERQRGSPSMKALVQKLNLKCTHEHQKSPS